MEQEQEGYRFDITPEDVARWKNDEVTQVFFDNVRILLADNDSKVHVNLMNYQVDDATFFNAAKTEDELILELPDIIIDNLKGEDKKDEVTS